MRQGLFKDFMMPEWLSYNDYSTHEVKNTGKVMTYEMIDLVQSTLTLEFFFQVSNQKCGKGNQSFLGIDGLDQYMGSH